MKKVVFVGYAWSKNEVHWYEKDTEYWIMNDMYSFVPRWDRLFDIHDDESILTRIPKQPGFNHFEELKKIKDKVIYMQRKWDEIPCSLEYPLQNIKDAFYIKAMGDKLLQTCTVTYMLALAIHEGFDHISLYGIDEAIDGEYKDEMPGVLYWLGVAQGNGIEIEISEHSPLLKSYFLYGYESPQKNATIIQLEKELVRVNEIKETAIKNQEYYFAEENKCIGAATMLEHIIKIFKI